jgi:hypothetical protein
MLRDERIERTHVGKHLRLMTATTCAESTILYPEPQSGRVWVLQYAPMRPINQVQEAKT